jgi:hypothetical protein
MGELFPLDLKMQEETIFSLILGPESVRDLRGNFPTRLRLVTAGN